MGDQNFGVFSIAWIAQQSGILSCYESLRYALNVLSDLYLIAGPT